MADTDIPAATSIPDRGPELKAVNIVFIVLSLVAVALRCYVRVGMVKAFGLDDWLMLLATVFYILYIVASTTGVYYGTGRHRSDLAIEDYERGMQCWWFCYLWYAMTMITSKLSVGCFLVRLITKRLQKWITYMAMGVSVLAGAVFFVVTIFQCHPVSFFWNERQEGGTCIPADVIIGLAFLYSCFSCISDFTFAILPAFVIWSLKMKLRTKLALVPLLAMGCVASCAVIARFPYLTQIRSQDFLWATTDVAIWSTVEQGLTITAASLATLRPLMKSIGYRMGWTSKATTRGGPHSGGDYYGGTSGRYGNNVSITHGRKGSTHLGHLSVGVGAGEAYKLSNTNNSSPNSTTIKSPIVKSPMSPWEEKKYHSPSRAHHHHHHHDTDDISSCDEDVRYVIQSPPPVHGKDNIISISSKDRGLKKKASGTKLASGHYIASDSEEELRRPSSSHDV